MAERAIGLGVAGLGRGFTLMLPSLRADSRVRLVAAADSRAEARARFAEEFGAPVYDTVDALCRDPAVEAVYVATPHQLHAAHARSAAAAGKHMLIEKPLAVTIEDCEAIAAAARAAGVAVVVGHSHSFDRPIAETKRLIDSGAVGALKLITAFNFTDFMYRPRRPEELDTSQGGGAIFNQGSHQVDMARYLAGGLALGVRAVAGIWDKARPSEGAYAALVTFGGGIAATLTYSGYAHFDSDEFCGWVAESGLAKDAGTYGAARRELSGIANATAEAAFKAAQGYGAANSGLPASAGRRLHAHFGVLIASCERADLRPLPEGVMTYGDDERRLLALAPPVVPRAEVIDELYAAVVAGAKPLHSAAWGLATLEVCHAILRSAMEGREIALRRQVTLGGH